MPSRHTKVDPLARIYGNRLQASGDIQVYKSKADIIDDYWLVTSYSGEVGAILSIWPLHSLDIEARLFPKGVHFRINKLIHIRILQLHIVHKMQFGKGCAHLHPSETISDQ